MPTAQDGLGDTLTLHKSKQDLCTFKAVWRNVFAPCQLSGKARLTATAAQRLPHSCSTAMHAQAALLRRYKRPLLKRSASRVMGGSDVEREAGALASTAKTRKQEKHKGSRAGCVRYTLRLNPSSSPPPASAPSFPSHTPAAAPGRDSAPLSMRTRTGAREMQGRAGTGGHSAGAWLPRDAAPCTRDEAPGMGHQGGGRHPPW